MLAFPIADSYNHNMPTRLFPLSPYINLLTFYKKDTIVFKLILSHKCFIETLFSFTDIKECSQTPNPCHHNATCTELQGSFNCSCNQGYIGNGTYCKGW